MATLPKVLINRADYQIGGGVALRLRTQGRRAAANNIWSGHDMMFTSEFFRIRERDNAHATLGRITHIAPDLESAKVKAKSLFDTLNLPKNPDGLRISDQDGQEMFFWTPATGDC
jgi:hypothetical protein